MKCNFWIIDKAIGLGSASSQPRLGAAHNPSSHSAPYQWPRSNPEQHGAIREESVPDIKREELHTLARCLTLEQLHDACVGSFTRGSTVLSRKKNPRHKQISTSFSNSHCT